jgi:hypothetical protein
MPTHFLSVARPPILLRIAEDDERAALGGLVAMCG